MTDPKPTRGVPELSAEAKTDLRERMRAVRPSDPDATSGSLRQLRRIRALTQTQLAETIGAEQDRISRLERRADLRISTLRDYVAGLGGTLRLVAEFPDREPYTIELPERERPVRRPGRPKPTIK